MQGIGLVMAYRNRFGEDALQVARQYWAQVRTMLAENSKPSLNIVGSDASPVAAALGAFLMRAARIPDLAKVQGDRVLVVGEGFRPAMEAAKMLNAPLDKVCLNCSLPMFEGIASAINPNVKLEVPQARFKGDKSCKEIFTIP